MLTIYGRSVTLREVTPADVSFLYNWRNDERFMFLCSTRRNTVSFSEFEEELKQDLNRDRFMQCLIQKGDKPIGTIYAYNVNRT